MADLEQQLNALKSGKSRRIKGISVERIDNNFVIDGDTLTLEEAVAKLDQTQAASAYDKLAFFEKVPYSSPISERFIKIHRCSNRAEHLQLLKEVKERKNYLWSGMTQKIDGKMCVKPPLVIDWESVPDVPEPQSDKPFKKYVAPPPDPEDWDGGLSCPFCAKGVATTSGRTNHVKHDHPEKLSEYFDLLRKVMTVKKANRNEDDEDDVVSRSRESDDSDGLRCPFCQRKMSSTSGVTNHIKVKHPNKLQEHLKCQSLGTA